MLEERTHRIPGFYCSFGSKRYFFRDSLVQATGGNLYGTTLNGGANLAGTVFRVTQDGGFTTLYSFCAQGGVDCTDGEHPYAGLVQGIDDNFYGTTSGGGSGGCCGTVFKITPEGAFATLHTFDQTDGDDPVAPLIQASNGHFYGTTESGGEYFGGTAFEITSNGDFTSIHSFCESISCVDGSSPAAALLQDKDGNFYGTTMSGGEHLSGTVFKLTTQGSVTVLYSFCSQAYCMDGEYPGAPLVQGTDGNFYGTTPSGGPAQCFDEYYGYYCGSVFQVTPDGTLTSLHGFDISDGDEPTGGVIQSTNGKFYGTTYFGGEGSAGCGEFCGTVFSISMGLGPFVETNPQAGKTGTKIGILGNDLTGTTGVSFNGTVAVFTVKSQTFIIATVPSGATSGVVSVMLPDGTLSSDVPFIILK